MDDVDYLDSRYLPFCDNEPNLTLSISVPPNSICTVFIDSERAYEISNPEDRPLIAELKLFLGLRCRLHYEIEYFSQGGVNE